MPGLNARGTIPRESGGRHALAPNTSRLLPTCTLIPLTGARVLIVSTTTEVSRPTTAGLDRLTSSTRGAGIAPGAVPVPEPGLVAVGSVPAAHCARVTLSLISVTAPVRASSRPFTVAPSLTEIEVSARMFPWNAVRVPSVAELPTCQKTLHAWAPLTSRTLLSVAVIERRRDLEDEHRARVALRVERQVAR